MQIESLKLDFHVDFFPPKLLQVETEKLEFYLGTRVLDTRNASFQHCFKTWQLTKFFYIYCYLARTIIKTHGVRFAVNGGLLNHTQNIKINEKKGKKINLNLSLSHTHTKNNTEQNIKSPKNRKLKPLIYFLLIAEFFIFYSLFIFAKILLCVRLSIPTILFKFEVCLEKIFQICVCHFAFN